MNARVMSRWVFLLVAVISIAMAATGRRANALWMNANTQKWPNGVIPVCFTDASLNHPNAAKLRSDLEQAAARYSNVARIKFVSKLPGCAGGAFDAGNACGGGCDLVNNTGICPPATLVIEFSGGAFKSGIGYRATQTTVATLDPNLSSPDWCAQELGHALGFEHEQDRWENVGGSLCPRGINYANQMASQNHLRTQFDVQSIESYCRTIPGVELTHQDVTGLKIAYGSRLSIGIFNTGGWWLDDGDGEPNSLYDAYRGSFGQAGDIPLVMRDLTTGGCAQTGHSRVAIYRGNGLWSVDADRNGYWNVGDPDYNFGTTGDRPVVGVFGGSPSFDEMAVYRNGNWYMDSDASGYWTGSDRYAWFGIAGDIPVVGAWSAQTSGWTGPPRPSFIGVFRGAGSWSLDMNGNGTWDNSDVAYNFGTTGDTPVTGDWNGDGRTKVGVYRNGDWYLDFNGNGYWDPNPDTGDVYYHFGQVPQPGDIPVVGDWSAF